MKSALILLLLAVGCGSAPEPDPDRASVQHQVPRPPNRQRYRLVGLPTGPRLFYDQARCLQYLKTYSEGMEAGLGRGSSQDLSCEPE